MFFFFFFFATFNSDTLNYSTCKIGKNIVKVPGELKRLSEELPFSTSVKNALVVR